MTLEEAKALAKEVVDKKSRSYVQAAQALATFVSSLPTPPSLDGKVIGTLEGACIFVPLAEYEALVANQRHPECTACVSAGIDTCDHVIDANEPTLTPVEWKPGVGLVIGEVSPCFLVNCVKSMPHTDHRDADGLALPRPGLATNASKAAYGGCQTEWCKRVAIDATGYCHEHPKEVQVTCTHTAERSLSLTSGRGDELARWCKDCGALKTENDDNWRVPSTL